MTQPTAAYVLCPASWIDVAALPLCGAHRCAACGAVGMACSDGMAAARREHGDLRLLCIRCATGAMLIEPAPATYVVRSPSMIAYHQQKEARP